MLSCSSRRRCRLPVFPGSFSRPSRRAVTDPSRVELPSHQKQQPVVELHALPLQRAGVSDTRTTCEQGGAGNTSRATAANLHRISLLQLSDALLQLGVGEPAEGRPEARADLPGRQAGCVLGVCWGKGDAACPQKVARHFQPPVLGQSGAVCRLSLLNLPAGC